jgi:hypothetical protein
MVAAGQWALAGLVSAQVAALTKGALRTMLLSKLKAAAAVLTVVAFVGGGSVRWLQETVSAGQEQFVNDKLDEGGPRLTGFVALAAQDVTAQKTSRVAAWVNGKPIFEDEVLNILGPQFRKPEQAAFLYRDAERQKAIKQFDAIVDKAFNKTLDKIIDSELLMQDAIRMLERHPKFMEKLKGIASKETQKQIASQMRSAEVPTIEQCEQVLLAQGTTLETIRRMLERDVIAGEYFRAKFGPQIEKRITPETIRWYYQEHFDETTTLDEATQRMITSKLSAAFADQERRQLVEQLRENAVIEIPSAQTP